MISFKEFLSEESKISQSQLNELEKVLDALFSEINMDIEFTRHFLDRVNDERNMNQIRVHELRDMFRAEFRKYKEKFKNMKPNFEALLLDIQSNINIPFVIKWDARNKELDLIAKTVMRKKNFMTRNKKFKV